MFNPLEHPACLEFPLLLEETAWAQHIPAPGEVTTIDHGSYTEVRVRVPWGDPKMFLRLEVGTQ